MKNLIRAAAFAPRVTVGGVESNRAQLAAQLREAAEQGCDLAVFPELCLTGSTAGDLFLQPLMIDCAFAALTGLAALTDTGIAAVVGLPLRLDGRLYDCAAVLQGGRLRGLVPKRRLVGRANGGILRPISTRREKSRCPTAASACSATSF